MSTPQLTLSWAAFTMVVAYLVNVYRQCQYRVPITYLIIALTIYSIIVIQYLIPDKITQKIITRYLFISIITFVVLFGIFMVPVNSISQTLLFIIFTILLAMIINPLYRLSRHNQIVKPCLITTVAIFLVFSLVAYTNPNLISFRWGNVLFFSLIGLIMLRLSFFWFRPSHELIKYSSYIGIVLFIAFILYDTKLMISRANNCQRPYSYLKNTISLVLDFVNLLTDVMSARNISLNK